MSSSTTATATARIVRRRTLRVAGAALTVAAAFSLTACSGSDGAASKPGGQSGGGVAAEASGAGSSAGAQGADAPAGNAKSGSGEGTSSHARSGGTSSHAGSGGTASSRAGSGGGSGKGKFCRTSDLVMEAVDSSPDQKVGKVTVQMTNKGGTTCSATGFAGVDLKDADGTSAPVHRGGEQPRITGLKPGDTATFSISYAVDFSGDSLASPTNIIVTPPNETHSVSLKWPAEALKLAGPYDEKIKVHPVGIAN
ncbi:DUF4232 domain-containing protein [Streptomyces sp. 769]|uniref:DUF4232 domain-containing protein n=1 Tax=Streptomyces sp. 769 TaxID=1262452 RepID=UPI00057F007A|nr:DUF4232 domain-containing protein [Streptomyces sp. 769]